MELLTNKVKTNLERIDLLSAELKLKISKAQLDQAVNDKLDVAEFRELVPEGYTPKQYFGMLLDDAVKANGEIV